MDEDGMGHPMLDVVLGIAVILVGAAFLQWVLG